MNFQKKYQGTHFQQPAAADWLKLGQDSDLAQTWNKMITLMSGEDFALPASSLPTPVEVDHFMMNVFADIELFHNKKKDFLISA